VDTCFTLSNDRGTYAYVHHFTLHDYFARGYVRPAVVAFVSDNWAKIMGCFDELFRIVSKITRVWKTGNRRVFLADLVKRAQDLEATRDAIRTNRSKLPASAEAEIEAELEDIRRRKAVIEQVIATEKEQADAARSSAYGAHAAQHAHNVSSVLVTASASVSREGTVLDTLMKINFEKELRTIAVLSGPQYAAGIRRLRAMQRRFKKPYFEIIVER
jgi:hypothetical protein